MSETPLPSELVAAHTRLKKATTVVRHVGFIIDTSPDNIAHKVFHGLYVGSQDAAGVECIDMLKSNNITHMLCLVDGIAPCHPYDFSYITLPLLDIDNTDAADTFEKTLTPAFAFIDDAIHHGGCVLVYCNAGISRSTAVACAYIMKEMNASVDEAMHLIREGRPCARPNDGFMRALRSIERTMMHAR